MLSSPCHCPQPSISNIGYDGNQSFEAVLRTIEAMFGSTASENQFREAHFWASSTPYTATVLARVPNAASCMPKVSRHPTGRMMSKPSSKWPRRAGPVPYSAAKHYRTSNCLNSGKSRKGTPPSECGTTPSGGSRKSHEVDLAALPGWAVCAL